LAGHGTGGGEGERAEGNRRRVMSARVLEQRVLGRACTAFPLLLACGAGWATTIPATPPRGPSEDGTRLAVLEIQIALEERHFSPGLLDGVEGPKTRLAIRALEAAVGEKPTGLLASARRILGRRAEPCTAPYRITAADAAEVDPCPTDWNERSRREQLLYPTLSNLIAEKFHTSERCLAWLNPEVDLAALAPGREVVVPKPGERPKAGVKRVEIDLSRKTVLLLGSEDRLVGLVHCSIARDTDAVTRGVHSVKTVVENPGYTFDPKKWPEVTNVERKLSIPPGPRSPVGLRWIGLDAPGVGIHGTPEPENIGKTGSHGCFRLTNWDAVHVAASVEVGTRVRVVDSSPVAERLGAEP
jgi:lipoprotein-anchoring transpeptidase ErfK/SrfK